MAVVAVTADVARIAEAKIVPDTGTWGNDGGGGGISDEPDIVYQNDTSQSRKIGTTIIGRDYTHGAGTDMDGTPANRAHYIAKIWVTNYAVLLTRSSPALHMKIGSSSSDHHWYYLFGSDNYPAKGGWQIVAIAPAVTGYQDSTDQGTPNDSSILYWSILSDFSTGSKAENVAIDAIDVGLGLCLVGGDGGDTDGVFADFVSADEGTAANRWGFVFTEGPVVYVTGQLAIGQTSAGTSTLTVFQDSGKTVVWRNGLVLTGFNRFLIDLATASTDIDLTNCSLLSEGQIDNDGDRGYTTTEDSRPILQVTGAAAATFGLTSCVLDNWASFALNVLSTLTNCTITNSGQIDCGTGAKLNGLTCSGYTGAADSSAIKWNVALDPDGDLDDMTITKGALAHHAIEFGTSAPLTQTLRGCDFSGFNAADAQNDSTFFFADRGSDVTWTLNAVGCTGNLTYKKARVGDTVVIVADPVTTQVTVKDGISKAAVEGAAVTLYAAGAGPFPYELSVTSLVQSGGTATATTASSHNLSTGNKVWIAGASPNDYNRIKTITVTGATTFTYPIGSGVGSPATGTIICTAVFIDEVTGATGIVSDSRVFSSDQDVAGYVSKGTKSPLYVRQDLSGTIDDTDGLSLTALMQSDE